MRLVLLATLAVAAFGQNPPNYCKANGGLTPEWPNGSANAGWYCRCASIDETPDSDKLCKKATTTSDCSAMDVKGKKGCTWKESYVSSGKLPTDLLAQNPSGGAFFNDDRTLTDCDGKVFSASDCAYRNKENCADYLGDGICDFGQRFTSKGVRSGPNLACDKFANDKGDCDCQDTMTCDGYCLDDFACKKKDYNFDTCANWYSDNVCDYGQRTSDFGVSINFDCHIDWLKSVPKALAWNHDNGACEKWDWKKRYTTQEYLDNFDATCPTAMPTTNPTKEPTPMPSQTPTGSPTDCKRQVNDDCPNLFALNGNWEACCKQALACGMSGYIDPQSGKDVCVAPTKPPTNPPTEKKTTPPGPTGTGVSFCRCETRKGAVCTTASDNCQYRECMQTLNDRKKKICVKRPENKCNTARKNGRFNKKLCESLDKAGEYCALFPNVFDQTDIANKVKNPKIVRASYCFKYMNDCAKYAKKRLCVQVAPTNKHFCAWDKSKKGGAEDPRCVVWKDARCETIKKKKDCMAWKSFGCEFIKKKKDKPPSLKAFKCIAVGGTYPNKEYATWKAAGGSKKKAPKCASKKNKVACTQGGCSWDVVSGACVEKKKGL